MARCDDCPLTGLDCPGRRWPAKCAAILAADPGDLARSAALLGPDPDTGGGLMMAAAPNPHLALLDAAKSCPHRGPCPRGCRSDAACALGRGDLDGGATSTLSNCLRCVAEARE